MPLITLGISTPIIILLIVAILLVIYFAISYIIYKKVLVDYNVPEVNLVDQTDKFFKPSFDWFQEIPKEDIEVTSYDELKLYGYYIPSYNKNSKDIAIIVHGYQSKATDMIIIAKMYAEMGFQVILTDLRGHGQSEGTFTTFGYYEKYDLKKWINFAIRTYGADSNILIHGVSMGAATAMMVTGLDIPKEKIKFLLLDSGFNKLRHALLNPNKSRLLKVFYPGLNVVTYSKHRFVLDRVNPIKQMKRNTIPFLIVQGDKDTAVTVSMAKDIYDSSPTITKELLIIKDSKHALGFKDDYQLCYDTLYKMIKPIFDIKKIYETKS
ncbi:MAG: alpha/beta hydrolase [Tenericutes bacterium]|nr:alpha/beta hydrolase [Mycoplasmatota bacterium]